MRISRNVRKMHDPWGNKHYNMFGSAIRFQYIVGYGTIKRDDDSANPDKRRYYVDRVGPIEATHRKFVYCTKYSVEKLRR